MPVNKEQDDMKDMARSLFNASPIGAGLNAAAKAGQAIQSVASSAMSTAQQAAKDLQAWEKRTQKRMGY